MIVQLTARMAQVDAFPFLIATLDIAGLYVTFVLANALIKLARWRWLRYRRRRPSPSSIFPESPAVTAVDESLVTTVGVTAVETFPPAAASVVTPAAVLQPDAVAPASSTSPASIWDLESLLVATSSSPATALPKFDDAVESKVLVGPLTYRMEDLPRLVGVDGCTI